MKDFAHIPTVIWLILLPALVPDATIPQWAVLVGLVGMPVVGLLGIAFTFLHVGNKITQLEVNTNSKMDRLLALTEASARAAGVLEGRAAEKADAKGVTDRATLDTGLRAEGAAALLEAQQTPPAEHGP